MYREFMIFWYLDPQLQTMICFSGLVTFIFIYSLGLVIFRKTPLEERLQELSGEAGSSFLSFTSVISGVNLASKKKKRDKKIKSAEGDGTFFEKIILLLSVDWEKQRLIFEQAGVRDTDAHKLFIYGKSATSIVAALVGAVLANVSPALSAFPIWIKALIIFVFTLMGWYVFDLQLKSMVKSRVEQFEHRFPDVLDLMMICVETGLSFNKSIDYVAREMSVFSQDISKELTITAVEMDILLDRRQALVNLINRVPSTTVRSFATTLIQSIQQGTSLKHALGILSEEVRDRRMQAAENKAARLPSLLIIPLVVFILPNLFIVLLGPSMVHLMRTM